MATSFELRLLDIARLKELSLDDPSLGEATEPAQFTDEFLEKIGITFHSSTLGNGYIKHSYRDFIVEEISDNNNLVDISPGSIINRQLDPPSTNQNKKLRLEVDMVKQGFATFEAVERLAEELGLEQSSVTYAGLKDGKAITSQRISINNTSIDRLPNLNLPNIFFKNGHYRVGMRNPGELSGNRFTILVRTETANHVDASQKIEGIKKEGFLNFFSLQRFGSRLIAHEIGRQIMLGRYEDAVRLLIAGISPNESRALQNIRNQAISVWGDWEKISQLYSQFPYFLQHEIKAIKSLKSKPGDMVAALKATPDQTKMAHNAYNSYCFNRALSIQATSGQIDLTIPLLGPESVDWYNKYLPDENLKQLRWHQPALNLLGQSRSRQIPTKAKVTIHSVTPCDAGLIFHFDLPKGAYATTFLAELFSLYQGRPVPDWVSNEEIDTRAIIGYSPISMTEQAFPTLEAEQKNDD